MTGEVAGGGGIAGGSADWVRHGRDRVALERIEAFFSGRAYELHRHDTYAIGRTLAGVQSFNYRGALRTSLPGGTIVLHPDEAHDGHAGGEGGFHYRIAYVEPAAIQAVLGGRRLPFIRGGLSDDPRLFAAAGNLLRGLDDRIEPLEFDDAIHDLAWALAAAGEAAYRDRKQIADYAAAERAREYLRSLPPGGVALADLERVSGRDRFGLSRDFRALFGTSPYRYLVMRRLDNAKAAMRRGSSAAAAAIEAGFADQAHMTRHFTRAFGVTPGRWLRRLRAQ